ncbi:MAG: amidohydrolase family protein, partial [Thermoprotei archaeon]|nr:amidohydrolase family protein [Thermoprotei archaeon]
DHPVVLQRNLFLQLRFFRRFGMSKAECISIITSANARILGIENILGTVEKGKLASLIVWNGDPFSLESYPITVIAEGEIVYKA